MKTVFGILCLFVMTISSAQAETVWFALDPPRFPVSSDLPHYPNADAACRTAYAADITRFTNDVSYVLPYNAPSYFPGFGAPAFECTVLVNIGGDIFTVTHVVAVVGDACPDGQTYDNVVGMCAASTDQQNRRQEGDPNDKANNSPSNCQGDPINAAIGNQFEKSTDYVDTDGELIFSRFYNSTQGKWRHSYSASLAIGMGAAALTFEDGRSSIFSVTGNVATAEPTERGSLVKSGSNWVYSSPRNETLTFNSDGQLLSIKSAEGLTQTLSYGYDSTFTNTQVTVKDSRGHTLVYSEGLSTGQLVALTAPGVSATYAYNDTRMLVTATRALQGKTVSQTYLYEDPNNPAHLTGLIDERGIRSATWTYDIQGRATSSTLSGGLDKTAIGYVDGETTTVTNALGHVVTYKYGVVAGMRQTLKVTGAPAPACPISNSSFTYDARGQIATQTDALGHITAFDYDTQGRIISKTEAKGTAHQRVTTTTWDGASFRPKTVTTADRVTTYTYDTQGRLLSTQTHSIKE